jgi:hypothetical protein
VDAHQAEETPPVSMPSVSTPPVAKPRAWGPWFAKAAFESLMILVSILLAFAIDNWREDNERARRLAEARVSLMQELRFNRELLAKDTFLPHHQRLKKVYQDMVTSDSTDRAREMFKTGIHPTPLRDAAWRSFLVSGVAGDLPFALHARLAGIYGDQESLDFLHRTAVGALLSPRADRETPAFTRDMIRTVTMYLTDVVANEEGLRKEYDAAVIELEAASAAQ